MEIYIAMCKIDSQWEFSVWFRKLKQWLCINLEGWTGREMGGRFRREGIYVYAAKSLQSCPTLCDLIDGSPPGSTVPGILQARTLEWVAISFSNA